MSSLEQNYFFRFAMRYPVPRVAAAIGTHTCCVCAKVCPRLFLLEAAPNPISEKEEYTPALLVTTQCTMFPDLIKILHLSTELSLARVLGVL